MKSLDITLQVSGRYYRVQEDANGAWIDGLRVQEDGCVVEKRFRAGSRADLIAQLKELFGEDNVRQTPLFGVRE